MKSLSERKIFLVGGSGGVGKTTVAASLAVRFAKEGNKTVVLTVDPAKRLLQALGLTGNHSELQKVNLGPQSKGELFATMLDVERDFDRVIRKFAKTDAQREKILNSKLYRTMVESLGGSHEYAAMERLLEFATSGDYDKIIVDTPPSHNAVDLLNAPQRLADFMDHSVLKWFQGKKPKYLDIFRQGTRLAMKALQTVFGNEFLSQLGEIFDDLDGMQAGFAKRNLEVVELLKSDETAFLLVSYPSEVRFRESKTFSETLAEKEIPLSLVILNRVTPSLPDATLPPDSEMRELVEYRKQTREDEERHVGLFRALFKDTPLFLIAKRYGSIHEVNALSQLTDSLVL